MQEGICIKTTQHLVSLSRYISKLDGGLQSQWHALNHTWLFLITGAGTELVLLKHIDEFPICRKSHIDQSSHTLQRELCQKMQNSILYLWHEGI